MPIVKFTYNSGFVYPGKRDVYFQARQRRRRDRVNQQEKKSNSIGPAFLSLYPKCFFQKEFPANFNNPF